MLQARPEDIPGALPISKGKRKKTVRRLVVHLDRSTEGVGQREASAWVWTPAVDCRSVSGSDFPFSEVAGNLERFIFSFSTRCY